MPSILVRQLDLSSARFEVVCIDASARCNLLASVYYLVVTQKTVSPGLGRFATNKSVTWKTSCERCSRTLYLVRRSSCARSSTPALSPVHYSMSPVTRFLKPGQ